MDTIPGNDPMPQPPHTPLAGLNPVDLLRQGAAEDTFLDDTPSCFHPPSVEELASIFSQFEILELIGQGGMGAVYKVRQKELDRIVALKILPPAIGQSPAFSSRFAREAKALAKLNHPGIVTIHEFGQTSSSQLSAPDSQPLYFILMEFVDGVNLAQLMKTGRISPREALAIVPQICDALQFAHDQGIVHRDIKPENILLDRLGRVKVADFGIAKLVGAAGEAQGQECPSPLGSGDIPVPTFATIDGKIMGTPQYMAPEQIEHPSEVDHRADIYALGVVFYQMLTGELPGKEFQAPSRKVQIDVRLDEIVLQAMEKNPELRFQQVSMMKTRVDEVGESTVLPSAPPVTPAVKKSSAGKWIAIGGGVLALACVLTVVVGMLLWYRNAVYERAMAAKRSADAETALAQIQAPQLKPGQYQPVAFIHPAQVFTLERGSPYGGVDLDTGTFVYYNPTVGADYPEGAARWREERGIDLVLSSDSASAGVLITGTQNKDVDGGWWDEAPEAALVESVLPPYQKRSYFDRTMTFLAPGGSSTGIKTYVYRTLAGSVGILRLGPTHSSTGVRVAWRLIKDRTLAVNVTGTMALPKDFSEERQVKIAKAALALLASSTVTEPSTDSQMAEASNGSASIRLEFPDPGVGGDPNEMLVTFPLTSGSIWTRRGDLYWHHAKFTPAAALALAQALDENTKAEIVESVQAAASVENELEAATRELIKSRLPVAMPVVIEVKTEGSLLLMGSPISEKDLQTKLESLKQQNPTFSVIVKTDARVNAAEIQKMMEALVELGVDNISFANAEKKGVEKNSAQSVAEAVQSAARVVIEMKAEGDLWFGGKPISGDSLIRSLEGMKQLDSNLEVALTIDDRVRNTRVQELLDSLKKSGITKISFTSLGNWATPVKPQAETGQVPTPLEIEIAIKPEGLFLMGERVFEAALKTKLQSLKQQAPDLIVSLNADNQVQYARVAEMIDLLTKLGITRISFASEEDAKDAGRIPSSGIESPKLQLLAWQDEVQHDPNWRAWRANGEIVKKEGMKLPQGFPSADTTNFSNAGLAAENPRFLSLWISHPSFDLLSVVKLKLLDGAGNPLNTPTKMYGTGVYRPSPENQNLGWITASICAGIAGQVPAMANLRLDYSAGPWHYWNEVPIDLSSSMPLSDGISVEVPGQAADGKAFIHMTRDRSKDPVNEQFDFVAVTKDGRELERSGVNESESSQVNTVHLMFDAPLEQIKTFRCRKRSIHTISWIIPLQMSPVVAKPETKGEQAVAGIQNKVAVATAETWLGGIDSGNYVQSWNDAGAFFQTAITEADWSDTMTLFRKPLGEMKSRKLLDVKRYESLPGAPAGEYVVMQFDTSFTAKEKAVETVTFRLEKDGRWKAFGYFIR